MPTIPNAPLGENSSLAGTEKVPVSGSQYALVSTIAAYIRTLTQTLTNKTVDLASNTVTGTKAQFNTALSDGDFATQAGTETLTNKSIDLASNTLTGTKAQFNTALSDGDFASQAGSETLTNKSVDLASNTLTGTKAQFNTAMSDADFATLTGSETLTNKALTSPAITTPTWSGAGSPVITLQLNANTNISPADSSTYYFGYTGTNSPNTSANVDPFIIPANGSIFRIDLFFTVTGTLASAETFTSSFRLNNTTDTTISASCKTDAAYQMFSNSALGITVAAGDTFQIKLVFPAWATNPTNVRSGAFVYLRMT